MTAYSSADIQVDRISLLAGQYRVLVDHADTRVVGHCGGFGNGKSWELGLFAMEELLTVPGNFVCLAAATYPQLKKSTMRSVFEVLRRYGIDYTFNQTDKWLTVPETGSELVFVTAGRQVPKENLQGPEFGALGLDEGEGIGEEQFQSLLTRVRKPGTSQRTRICFNPPHRGHWLERRFLTDPVPDWVLIQSSTYENRKILGEPYIRDMEGWFPPGTLRHRRYMLGEMGLPMEGAIYPEFSTARCLVEADYVEDLAARGRIVGTVHGLDLGFGHPTAFLSCMLDDEDVLYVVGEHHADGLSIAEHAQQIVRLYRSPGTIFSDWQKQERHEYGMLGIETTPAPKHIGVLEGIEAVRKRIVSGRLKLVRGACPALLNQMSTYRWARPKTDGVEFRDAPVKIHDDAQDALRYAVTGLDRAIDLEIYDTLAEVFHG